MIGRFLLPIIVAKAPLRSKQMRVCRYGGKEDRVIAIEIGLGIFLYSTIDPAR